MPGVYPTTLLEIAADRGQSPRDLLLGAGIDVAASELFEKSLTVAEHLRLMELVARTLRDPALGVEIGWRLPPTALGSLGYAILASATAGDALALLERHWPLVARALGIVVDASGDIARVELLPRLPMTGVHRSTAFEIGLVSLYRGFVALVPEAADEAEAWFDFPEPAHAALVRRRIRHVRYGMSSCELRIPSRVLAIPLPMANPVGLRAAVEWCEREEQQRGLAGQKILTRVRAELRPGRGGYPTVEETARRIGASERTLRRHLEREGTSYSELLESARRRDAMRMLEQPGLPAHAIATRLGYDDPANFTRAFRRWTGRTPSAYRAEARAKR